MTLAEFKAWFEGFTESIEGAPSAKQWKRIQARVKEIDGAPVTERIYVDRYWPVTRPWQPYWYSSTYGLNDVTCATTGAVQQSFNSSAAMLALGRADATLGD